MIDREFKRDFAGRAAVTASNWRGRHDAFAPAHLLDGDPITYWATDDGVTTGVIALEFDQPQTARYVVLQEHIALGQRVRSFVVEARLAGEWVEFARGTTIGYKRILRVDPVTTEAVRVRFTDAKACLAISSIALF